MSDGLTDLQLVERATSGDRDAFADIFRRHQHAVYRFALAMTGSPVAAEDIAQEAFLVVFRGLAKYDHSRATFTTYLYGIVRNLSRHRLRRERRFFPLDLIGPDHEPTSYQDDPSDALEDAELVTAVRRVLQKLPTRYRELILLCDLHGLSYADAAVVVRISTAAVRSRLHRGRQLLRVRLSPVGGTQACQSSSQKRAFNEV